MSQCGPIWPASTNATPVAFGRPSDTNFMPHCDMLIRYEMSQCHTFQLRKNVFSYEMCDIVTPAPHPEPAEGPCHPERPPITMSP